ncbi:lipid biosynthesis B12-binding/radical SAM protein [Desulfobulbus sp.]|uniref:lipid biosynthesis B12-binding/radical SAM protein n=1 Tax=Desulfobulbus sp. TaxID=895 RepID=UPI00286F254A|nr:lipid biosynthesis B12-binding/radical SAM protein [Desulfobulbus sp.]
MKVLLLSPNTLTAPYPVYPLGLDYVAGSLSPEHRVRIVDLQVVDRAALAGLLDDFAPEIVGISCRNIDNTDATDSLFFLHDYRELVAWLRQRTPALLVCGGCGFTIMPKRIFELLGVDYGIVGEGERFGLLVDALAQGRNPAEIPGVLVAGGTVAQPPPWRGKLYRRLPGRDEQSGFYVRNGGMLNLQSKRGCSFRCLYCPYPRIEGGTHRLTDPDEVARTAQGLQAAGARYLFLTDSAFNSDIDHSLAVAGALRESGLAVPWGAFFTPVALPAGYFEAMAAAGCRHVEFGTESLATAMLRAYRKPFRPPDVARAHRQARAAGLHVAHYFLLGGPGESAATVDESLDAIEGLDQTVLFFFIGIRIYPGTGLYDHAVAEGKIDRDTDLLQPVFYEPDAIDLKTIEARIVDRAAGRRNWLVGSGGAAVAATVRTLHRRGLAGPLWEYLTG